MSVTTFFSVEQRNPQHWDITSDRKRLFRIRGDIGDICVIDERNVVFGSDKKSKEIGGFPSAELAMAYICGLLMHDTTPAE